MRGEGRKRCWAGYTGAVRGGPYVTEGGSGGSGVGGGRTRDDKGRGGGRVSERARRGEEERVDKEGQATRIALPTYCCSHHHLWTTRDGSGTSSRCEAGRDKEQGRGVDVYG
jgi:hypothetical protein